MSAKQQIKLKHTLDIITFKTNQVNPFKLEKPHRSFDSSLLFYFQKCFCLEVEAQLRKQNTNLLKHCR